MQNTRLLFLSSQSASETKLSITNWNPGSRAKYSRWTARRSLLIVNGGIFVVVFGRYGATNLWNCHEEWRSKDLALH